jgi:hypothetical protein
MRDAATLPSKGISDSRPSIAIVTSARAGVTIALIDFLPIFVVIRQTLLHSLDFDDEFSSSPCFPLERELVSDALLACEPDGWSEKRYCQYQEDCSFDALKEPVPLDGLVEASGLETMILLAFGKCRKDTGASASAQL